MSVRRIDLATKRAQVVRCGEERLDDLVVVGVEEADDVGGVRCALGGFVAVFEGVGLGGEECGWCRDLEDLVDAVACDHPHRFGGLIREAVADHEQLVGLGLDVGDAVVEFVGVDDLDDDTVDGDVLAVEGGAGDTGDERQRVESVGCGVDVAGGAVGALEPADHAEAADDDRAYASCA
jgi:hypothetical protein